VRHTFSSSQRLHKTVDFEKSLKNKAIVEKWLAIHCVQNSEGHGRLGIIVSKRIIAKAADRNRIKRYIRESFRIGFSNINNSLDIVVRLRKQVSFDEIIEFRQTMSRLLTKVLMADYDAPVSNVHKKLSVSN
jgi:ribonuclease P protein component